MRKTRGMAVLALAALLATGAPASAVIGTIDDVPAATLLLPYFEVDLEDPAGVTTLLSINNAAAKAVLAHVVLWSDASVPVLDFNIYLTGYDVQTLNLHDILVLGQMPQTASLGQDLQDLISPKGEFSLDTNFPSCTGQLPLPPLPRIFLDHLQAALTGRFSRILGGCAGQAFGDGIARGYVTVDAVNDCTLRFQGDSGYFLTGGNGDASDDNVLWGDYFVLDPAGLVRGGNLVSIEAGPTDPRTSVAGQYTFYGRYVGWNAADNREPLPTSFAVRYLKGEPFEGGTCIVTWRDSKVQQGAFACGTTPAWYPLGQESLFFWDEQENAMVAPSFPFSPQPPGETMTPFPAEAQCTEVGGDDLPVSFDFGWLYLNLNSTVAAAAGNPPADPAAAQGWVSALLSGGGRFTAGFNAIQLDNASAPNHVDPNE